MATRKKNQRANIKKNGGKSASPPSKALLPRRIKPDPHRKSVHSLASTRSVDPSETFSVRGVALFSDKTPAPGITVVVFDQDIAGEDRLGATVTGKDGSYAVVYTSSQFRRSKNESRNADIIVRVYGEKDEIIFQSRAVRNAPTELIIDVSLPAGRFVVHGRVTGVGKGQLVRAYDKDLRSEELLGEAITDHEGDYAIRYSSTQFKRAEKLSADLRIVVCDLDGEECLSSEIVFNASPDQIVDLEVTTGNPLAPSEYERYLANLERPLAGVALADLDGKDIAFLFGETSIDRQHLAWLASAAKNQKDSIRIDPSMHTHAVDHSIPTAVFYAWFRLGQPTDWAALQTRPIGVLRKALLEAIERARTGRVV